MAYFPFYMDVEGMVCLIAGGGKVASRKVFTMLEYGSACGYRAGGGGGDRRPGGDGTNSR